MHLFILSENGLIFIYILDKVVGFIYNNSRYYYQRNIQNDIVAIYREDGTLVCKYVYDAYGRHKVLNASNEEVTISTFIGNINPFRYRGYYYDRVLGLYNLNSRYYDPETCRFISPDVISIIDETSNTINGLNLYMYCNDNPVMMVDPSGHMPKWLRDVLDIGLYVVSAIAAVTVSVVLIVNHVNPKVAVAAGIATFGALNNLTNAIYYNYISDGKNDTGVTSSSYTEEGYINRWDRLDYTKAQTKEENYNLNAWRYFSEYNFHMLMWNCTKKYYTGKMGDGFLSDLAYRASNADIDPQNFETGPNWWRNIFYIGMGLLGL